MWIAAVGLLLAGASAAPGRDRPSSNRSAVVQARADHGDAVAVRPLVDRSALDVRQEPSRLLSLGWAAAAAAVALGLGLVTRVVTRAGCVVLARRRERRFDRGPPALAFA